MKYGIITLAAILLLSGTAWNATIYVPDNYPMIQDAINAASGGDTIIVRSGTYVENIDFVGKDITLTSEFGPAFTTIDGNQIDSVVKFMNSEGTNSILDGFTIRNGTTLNYCWGGGIHCNAASPTIRNNVIKDNYSAFEGGGILCISSCAPVITDNLITFNYAHDGGGISCLWGGDAQIRNNEVTRNSGESAGGIHCNSASPLIANNVIYRNEAFSYDGGGLGLGDSSPTLVNNLIYWNICNDEGGGICADWGSAPVITNNTIYANTSTAGGGIYCRGNVTPIVVTNTILWGNNAIDGKEMYVGTASDPSAVDISYSDVEGGQASIYVDPSSTLNWGTGMITSDPLFAAAANGDLHITWQSPCKNSGDNAAPSIQATDYEGDPRVVLGNADIGADEFYFHLYSMGNVVPGAPIDIKITGGPGMPVLLGLGAGIQSPPQQTPHGLLYLQTPVLATFALGQVQADGMLVYTATVPAGWITGDEHPFQALVGTWGGSTSKLTNLMTLTAE